MRRVRKLVLWRGESGIPPSCVGHGVKGKGDDDWKVQWFEMQASHEHRRETIGAVRNVVVSGELGERTE